MQAITVELQESFSYLPAILFIIAGIIGTLLILFLRKPKRKKPRVPVAKPVAPKNIFTLKEKYIRALTDIEQKRSADKIDDRKAAQAVSRVVRDFVYASTGIKVQNYTLMEIHAAKLPRLYELISQCYMPEFAVNTQVNVYEVINKARTVISEWN